MFRNMFSLFWLVVAAAGAQNSQNAAGDSLFTAGNFTQALAAFDMALKNNPKDSYAAWHCHQALGRILTRSAPTTWQRNSDILHSEFCTDDPACIRS